MKGIINSELDVNDLLASQGAELPDEVIKALKDPNYIIALLQKSFFDNVAYSVDDPRFDNITPAHFKATMQQVLQDIEDGVWEVLRMAEHACEGKGFQSHKNKP